MLLGKRRPQLFVNKETKSEELSKAHDQLCREIGRNLLRFQLLELLLKDLVSKSKIKVTLNSIKQPKTDSQTLGGISTRFFEEIVSELSLISADKTVASADELSIETRFNVALEGKAKTEWMNRLGDLIKERNALVHTSLKTMNFGTPEDCRIEIEKLIDQREQIQREISWLKSFCKSQSEMMKEIAKLLRDPDFPLQPNRNSH